MATSLAPRFSNGGWSSAIPPRGQLEPDTSPPWEPCSPSLKPETSRGPRRVCFRQGRGSLLVARKQCQRGRLDKSPAAQMLHCSAHAQASRGQCSRRWPICLQSSFVPTGIRSVWHHGRHGRHNTWKRRVSYTFSSDTNEADEDNANNLSTKDKSSEDADVPGNDPEGRKVKASDEAEEASVQASTSEIAKESTDLYRGTKLPSSDSSTGGSSDKAELARSEISTVALSAGDSSGKAELATPVSSAGDSSLAEEEASGGKEGSQEPSENVDIAWIPPPPIARMSTSPGGGLRRTSYYPQGFEWMDKGDELLTWRSGIIIAAVAAFAAFNFQWLAAEIILTTIALLGGMLGLLIIPPIAMGCLSLHLLTKLPPKALDKVVDVLATCLTVLSNAWDLATALLDLMPLQPVIAALASVYLVLSLHETVNPMASSSDIPLLVAGLGTVCYSIGLATERQLLIGAAAGTGVGALVLFLQRMISRKSVTDEKSSVALGGASGQTTPGAAAKQLPPSAPPAEWMNVALAFVTPAVVTAVALVGNLPAQLAIVSLYAVAVLLPRFRNRTVTASTVFDALENVNWGAPFQRQRVSPFSVLRFLIGYTAIVAARRVAYVLYLKAHGL